MLRNRSFEGLECSTCGRVCAFCSVEPDGQVCNSCECQGCIVNPSCPDCSDTGADSEPSNTLEAD